MDVMKLDFPAVSVALYDSIKGLVLKAIEADAAGDHEVACGFYRDAAKLVPKGLYTKMEDGKLVFFEAEKEVYDPVMVAEWRLDRGFLDYDGYLAAMRAAGYNPAPEVSPEFFDED